MNIRTASYISLFTFPAAWLLLRFTASGTIFPAAAAIVAGGLILAIITCRVAARSGDRASRNRSIWGISINAIYLSLLLYAIFVVIPDLKRLANELKQEADQKQQTQQQQDIPPSAPQNPASQK